MRAVLVLALGLAGCGSTGMFAAKTPEAAPVATLESDGPRPQARPVSGVTAAPKPPTGARTAAQFDTVSAEQKAAAVAPPVAAERGLGDTVASLGDPSKPGLWLETPLVSAAGPGRVEFNGKSAKVDLIPIAGEKTAGSRISLSAMQLIGAPLTDLPTIKVFAGS